MPVDADGDLHELAAVLVPHVDAVLAGVIRSDFGDDEAGELPPVKRDLGVLGGGHLLLVLEPGDLGSRLAPHGAGQAQGLGGSRVRSKTNQSRSRGLRSGSTIKVLDWKRSDHKTQSVFLLIQLRS